MTRNHMLDRRMPRPRRQKFFPTRSLSAALSSICSASSFFNLRFSSSRAFSFLASETSIPPNFPFHLYKVVPLIPCRRHSSSALAPASCSFKIPMICSSVKRLLRIVDLLAIDSTISWREFRGAGHDTYPVSVLSCFKRERFRTVQRAICRPSGADRHRQWFASASLPSSGSEQDGLEQNRLCMLATVSHDSARAR